MFSKMFLLSILSISFVLGVASGPYLHFSELEGVLPASPCGPLDAISIGSVLTTQILAVKVSSVTVAVPPSTMVEGGAVVLRVVVIPVFGRELHPIVLQHTVT